MKDYLKHWNLKNKKELEETIKELNSWFNEQIIEFKKNELVFNEEKIQNLEVTDVFADWEQITKKLKSIYLKKPENQIINEVFINKVMNLDELEKIQYGNKKTQEIIKILLKDKILIKTKKMVKINPDWGNEDFTNEVIFQN